MQVSTWQLLSFNFAFPSLDLLTVNTLIFIRWCWRSLLRIVCICWQRNHTTIMTFWFVPMFAPLLFILFIIIVIIISKFGVFFFQRINRFIELEFYVSFYIFGICQTFFAMKEIQQSLLISCRFQSFSGFLLDWWHLHFFPFNLFI